MEAFVTNWSEVNLAKLAKVAPRTPVTVAFESEDYEYFDFENLHSFEIATVCNLLAQQCYSLQPQLYLIRQELSRAAEIERRNLASPGMFSNLAILK